MPTRLVVYTCTPPVNLWKSATFRPVSGQRGVISPDELTMGIGRGSQGEAKTHGEMRGCHLPK